MGHYISTLPTVRSYPVPPPLATAQNHFDFLLIVLQEMSAAKPQWFRNLRWEEDPWMGTAFHAGLYEAYAKRYARTGRRTLTIQEFVDLVGPYLSGQVTREQLSRAVDGKVNMMLDEMVA